MNVKNISIIAELISLNILKFLTIISGFQINNFFSNGKHLTFSLKYPPNRLLFCLMMIDHALSFYFEASINISLKSSQARVKKPCFKLYREPEYSDDLYKCMLIHDDSCDLSNCVLSLCGTFVYFACILLVFPCWPVTLDLKKKIEANLEFVSLVPKHNLK